MRTGTPAELITFLRSLHGESREKLYDLKEHRNKRSLPQNDYYWAIVSEIAKEIKRSKPETHNLLMRSYGADDIVCGATIGRWFPDTDEVDEEIAKNEKTHLRPTSKVKDGKRLWILLKGSHAMDTKEMAALLEGAITEAINVGIPIDEIQA